MGMCYMVETSWMYILKPKVGENQIPEKKTCLSRVHHQNLPALSLSKEDRVMCLFTPAVRTCPLFWTFGPTNPTIHCFNSQGSTFLTRVFLNAPLSTAPVVWISIHGSLKIRAPSKKYLPDPPHQKQQINTNFVNLRFWRRWTHSNVQGNGEISWNIATSNPFNVRQLCWRRLGNLMSSQNWITNASGSKLASYFGPPLAKYEPPLVWLPVMKRNRSTPKTWCWKANVSLRLHPWNLTWNLKRSPRKRWFLLETIIFRFHVKFRLSTSSIFSAAFAICDSFLSSTPCLWNQTNWTRWQRNFRPQLLVLQSLLIGKFGSPNLLAWSP